MVDSREFEFCWTKPNAFRDSLAPGVSLHAETDDDEFYLIATKSLPRLSVVCTSSMLCSIRPKRPGIESWEVALAMAVHILQSGLLSKQSPAFWPLLGTYLQILSPRRLKIDEEDYLSEFLRYTQSIVLTNAIQHKDWTHLVGNGSFFNHSCVPNVFPICREALRIYEYKTCRAVAAEESLCMSYIEFPIDKKAERSALLNFSCECAACSGDLVPSEYALQLRTVPHQGHCWHCGITKGLLRRCKSCLAAEYCSRACQTENWTYVHNRVCKRWCAFFRIHAKEIKAKTT